MSQKTLEQVETEPVKSELQPQPITASRARFTDNGDGTVRDTQTGLMWMRCAVGQNWEGGTCCGAANTYSLRQLTAVLPYHYAGYNNWRLPTKNELVQIVDRERIPSLDNSAFPNQSGRYFWSSTPSTEHTEHAWIVSLYSGSIGSGHYKTGNYHVRLVREGASSVDVISPLVAGDYEEFSDIRKALDPRIAEWAHRSPSTLLGQGKWLLQHTGSDHEQACMALKLLSMSCTSEANDLLANFYLANASNQRLIAFLSHEEWHAAGVFSGKAFADSGVVETADDEIVTHATFRLAPDHAVTLVRAAIDLLKQNPTAFLPELTELRSLVFENNVGALSQAVPSEVSPLPGDTPSLAKVAKWLLAQESVTLIALRTYLLPLDLLPSAVIDELNELALDSMGEPALEENEGETVLVVREILAQVLACWDVA